MTDAAAIEAAIPGLASLSSALAAVRGQDGLCRHHDILLPASSHCDDFDPTIAQAGSAPNINLPPKPRRAAVDAD